MIVCCLRHVRTACTVAVAILATSLAFAQGSVALIGGGTESAAPESWSAAPYGWIVEQADFGSIVILSASATSSWLPDYFESLGARSASNLTIPDRLTADADATATTISEADGVFIKGGDQWTYVSQWRDTRTADAIRHVFNEGGVVAGTSAGAMVLSEVVFDARNGTVYPEETLADPYTHYLSLSTGFLDLVPGTLVDTHFTERGRIARLIPMIARWQAEHPGQTVTGIGIDSQTALLVDRDRTATVAGEGSVTIVQTTAASRFRIAEHTPPVITHVACNLLLEGYEIDLTTGRVIGLPTTARPVTPDTRPEDGWPSTTLHGADPATRSAGAVRIVNIDTDPYALQAGTLELAAGDGLVPATIVMSSPFGDPDYAENAVGGLLWGLSEQPGFLGLLLVAGSSVELRPDTGLRPGGTAATVVADSAEVTSRDRSRWVVFDDSAGTRQSVALLGLKIHILADGWVLLGDSGTVHERIPAGRPPSTRAVTDGEINPASFAGRSRRTPRTDGDPTVRQRSPARARPKPPLVPCHLDRNGSR